MQKTDIFETPLETMTSNLKVDVGGALTAIKCFAPKMEKRGTGTILLTGGGFALYPSAEYLTLSIGKAGVRCMVQALFPQLAEQEIHIATLTVTKVVSSGSEVATAAANAFWNLYSQARENWTWEATLYTGVAEPDFSFILIRCFPIFAAAP